MTKLSFEYIYNFFKENDCTLLETSYINSKTLMNYICSCGNQSKIRWNDFQQGYRCKSCGHKKNAQSRKRSQEEINQIFLDAGCECLDIYINTKTKMKYRCSCGNISTITLDSFQYQNSRCWNCRNRKISEANTAENHPNWNPDRSKIKIQEELQYRSKPFTKRFRKKHNIIGSEYHIDHIFPIQAFVEHNIFDLNIINDETNLRAIPAKENMSKSYKYNKSQFREKYKKELSYASN